MTFWNSFMLIGLSAVSIPIIIHLLNRRRAKIVEWGAMRFLLAALASRNRRIRIEEIILLALRCLWVALLVLAMAQPLVTRQSAIPWPLVLPTVLAAAILGGIAAAVWANRRWRWTLLAVSTALLVLAGSASAAEYLAQKERWSSDGAARDVVLVIDGSSSMTLTVEGMSNFQRAVEEAKAVVAACKPADAVAVYLAGSVPQGVIPSPVSDHKEINAALDRLSAPGGTLQVLEALKAATSALAKGKNPGKKIVLITDGQNLGWDLRSESSWQSLAAALRQVVPPRMPVPQVVCRTLPMPKSFNNLAAAGITLSRRVVGTDRPVMIDFRITNTGTSPMDANGVELSVDGALPMRQDVPQIPSNASETAHFDHRFERVGRHVLTARLAARDDMPADNTSVFVVDVIEKLPVLIVDGAAAQDDLEGAGGYIALAMAPRGRIMRLVPDSAGRPGTPWRSGRPGLLLRPGKGTPPASVVPQGKPAGPKEDDDVQYLVEAKVVHLADVRAIRDFSEYAIVVLANVSRLPKEQARMLEQFVRDGGGLLVAPGDRSAEVAADGSVKSFYDEWKTDAGEWICPARIAERRVVNEYPAHLAVKTFSHPALEQAADSTKSDAGSTLIHTYWKLVADERDPKVRVGGLFEGGDPFLAERHLGRGYVVMTAMSLDDRSGNLVTRKCFVPMMHQLTYYLAAPALVDTNVRPGAEVTIPLGEAPDAPVRRLAPGETIEVVTPSLQRLGADLVGSGADLRISFTGTQQPGLYRAILPASLRGRPASQPADEGVPFAVLGDAAESRLTVLTDADVDNVKRHLGNLIHAKQPDELTAAIAGGIPGQPLWEYLAIALLIALLAEIGLTRWICLQRRSHQVETVSFGAETVDIQTFRARARELLAQRTAEGRTVSKK